MKPMGKFVFSAALAALALFGLGGCAGAAVSDPPICGGTTDKTDRNAPKIIESKDLTSFYAHFYLNGEWSPGRENRFYTFEVKKDGQGAWTATAQTDTVAGAAVSVPADEELLAELRSIIDAHKLAAKNGVYRVTAGLPPEFQPCSFSAGYASGETLAFTENNNPDAEWAKETYLAFADWFAAKGDASLLPPEQSFGPIQTCSFAFNENGRKTRLSAVRVGEQDAIDGETLLLGKSVYDYEAKSEIFREYILFPEDYAENIHAILSAHDLRAFDYRSVFYRKRPREERPALQLHFKFTDGTHLNIDTSDAKDIETLRPLISELFAYHDSLFEG